MVSSVSIIELTNGPNGMSCVWSVYTDLHAIHGNRNTYKSFIGKEGERLYRMISLSGVGGLKKSTVGDYEASSS